MTTSSSSPADIEIDVPKRLCHLPVVMDVLRRSGILQVIDHAIREDPRSKVSTSECVAVMLCAIFLGHHDLWRMADRLKPYDLATIMGDPGFNLAEFTEERLARMLDELHAANPDRLMTGIAVQAIEQFELDTEFLQFDTTSLTFFGAYESEDFASLAGGQAAAPVITYGYSKDHRPDLKQLMFGSLVTRDGGVPLFGKALDGNTSDSTAAAEFFTRIRSLVADPREVCCVTDSKGWCGPVLAVAAREGLRVLSRLPRHHRLHALVMAAHGPAERIERPRRRKTNDPEVYEILGLDVTEQLTIEIPAAMPEGKPQRTTLEIPARAVRVFSSALLRQKRKTLERTRQQEAKSAKRTIADWQAEVHACAEDAQRAAARHLAEADYLTLTLTAAVQAVDGPFRRQRGRPRKAPEPALDAQRHYRVTYATAPADEAELDQRLRRAATFVQIRTRNPGWTITDAEMLDAYRCQYLCEHGFSWLKSGAGAKGINPIFLETPKRIASLCFLYVIGLMVWNLIQRTVRKNLTAWNTGLPYHRNKPSAKITTRFYFELFPSIQTIAYRLPGGIWQKKVVGLNQTTELAIKALGVRSDAFSPVR